MAKKTARVRERDSYSVGTGTRDITAAVDVGLGQIGSVTMSVEEDVVAEGEAPLPPQSLGLGTDLVGKLLLVEVTVSDVSVMTNKMKVIVKLGGGASAKRIEAVAEVQEEGDSVFFEIFVRIKR
jgi:hypothetical protein